MSDRDYSEIEKEIISFTLQRKEVLGISRGYDPEEGNQIYWLLTGIQPYSREFEDKISGLNIRLPDTQVMQWPTNPEGIIDAFLGEVIWKRS